MDELLDQFLIEGREQIQQAADDLLALERDPGDAARIDSVFRAIHTLKGSAGLFDLLPLSAVMHAAEDLIGALREGRLAGDRATIDALLAGVGVAEAWINALARNGGLPPGAAAQGRSLVAALRAPLAGPAEPVSAAWLPALLDQHGGAVEMARDAGQGLTGLRYIPARDCFFLGDDPLALLRTVPGLVALSVAGSEPWVTETFDPFACTLVIEALSTAPPDDIAAVFRFVADQVVIEPAVIAAQTPAEPGGAEPRPGEPVQRTLRIDASRVDTMVDLIGELIVAKNGLGHLVAQAEPGLAKALTASHADIERLIGQMHRAVMGARMVPLSQTTRRFPRLVRDIAAQLDRPVQFDITGAEIEADKAVVDGLYEPLLHMLRNAIDHGIEPPEVRLAVGKPAAGRVTLAVSRDGDRMVIAVSDDGAGIDPERLRAVAASRKLATDGLDDAAVLDLLFAPGFSTTTAVTSISGRGVGMDAVRAAVQAMGGHATITSRLGAGSAVRLTLPQRVAITTAVVVRVAGERYGVPIDIVVETARIAWADILPVQGGQAFVLRDRTIPLLHLTALLHLPASPDSSHARVLIVALGDQMVGLVVDGFDGRREILLRPLSGLLAAMPGLLGGALMGDGRVLMVLDLPGLIG
jgi:two-component system chemotaxis sensor kinase CheA